MRVIFYCLIIISVFFYTTLESYSCTQDAYLKNFRKSEWSNIPNLEKEDLIQFWSMFLRNCQCIADHEATNSINNYARWIKWKKVCSIAKFQDYTLSNNSIGIREFLQQHLQPWIFVDSNSNTSSGILTGYYEPLLRGSRYKHGSYLWPIIGVPDDLIRIDLSSVYPELQGKMIRGRLNNGKIVPYYSRAEIGLKLECFPIIAWTDDLIDNYFLGIQGSGRVILTDEDNFGKVIRLSFAEHNGHPYRSVSNWLIKEEALDKSQISVSFLKDWTRRNPGKITELLNTNPSFVFFSESDQLKSEIGPVGACGIELTAMRSVAIDSNYIPLCIPMFISFDFADASSFQHFVFAQDTGSAVKGSGRLDLFVGSGLDSGLIAGKLKQPCKIWILLPKI